MPSINLNGTSVGTVPFINEPVLGLVTGPTDYANISEIQVMNVSSNYGGGFDVGLGIGSPGTPRKFSLEQKARADTGSSDSLAGIFLVNQWTVPPSVPTKFIRRWTNPYTHSWSTKLTFVRGLKLAPSTALILWSLVNVLGQQPGLSFRVELSFEVDT